MDRRRFLYIGFGAVAFLGLGDKRKRVAAFTPSSGKSEGSSVRPGALVLPEWEQYNEEEAAVDELRKAFKAQMFWPEKVLGFGYYGKGKYYILFSGKNLMRL
ncbi:MAG: hypothetical protein QXJ62_06220 [Nitrososphaeria archaeon]